MKKLLRYLRPIWWLVLIDVVLLVAQSYFALLIPKIMTNITKIMEYPQNYMSEMSNLIDLWNIHWIAPTGDRMKDIWIIGGVMIAFAFGFFTLTSANLMPYVCCNPTAIIALHNADTFTSISDATFSSFAYTSF